MRTYEKALDGAFWQQVRTADAYHRHRRELEKNWETFCAQPVEALPYHEFRRYYLDGDRRSFEKFFFGRRQALNTACFLSLIYPENETYLAKAQDLIFAMCNEFTWVLPAHQKTLEDYNPVHIDLFAAESALNLSEVYVRLEHRLDAFLLRRIRGRPPPPTGRPFAPAALPSPFATSSRRKQRRCFPASTQPQTAF